MQTSKGFGSVALFIISFIGLHYQKWNKNKII